MKQRKNNKLLDSTGSYIRGEVLNSLHNINPGIDTQSLTKGSIRYYKGTQDGGLTHIGYELLSPKSSIFKSLPLNEQVKVGQIQADEILHSKAYYQPEQVSGHEVTGTFVCDDNLGYRKQQIVFKVPDNWNGDLVVVGTGGLRNEWSNERILGSWLLKNGYAYISGNKGMTNGDVDGVLNTLSVAGNHLIRNLSPKMKEKVIRFGSRLIPVIEREKFFYKFLKKCLAGKEYNGMYAMFSGKHLTRHWGNMMIDMASWAKYQLENTMDREVNHIYTIGLSNGGYQASRALEIDHQRVLAGKTRLFDGGVNWSGTYWPDSRAFNTDNGEVTPEIFATTNHLITTSDKATLAMGWVYSDNHISNEDKYAAMLDAGFTPQSAFFWYHHNKAFDHHKEEAPAYGLGVFNTLSDAGRTDLLGKTGIREYSSFSGSSKECPPLYDWLKNAVNGGWTKESIKYALELANTGEFSAPMISIFGDSDALLALNANGKAYRKAIENYGNPGLHRLNIIPGGLHTDNYLNPDDNGHFPVAEAIKNGRIFQVMQDHAERAFWTMVDWVEKGKEPSER